MGWKVIQERIKPKRVKQSAHLARVAGLGCCVCRGPAEIHHVRTGNQARDDRRVVGLCAGHHRLMAYDNWGQRKLAKKL